MISKDFKIDFIKKRIYSNPKVSKKIYKLNEPYSFLQDTFDELENTNYEVPMSAQSSTQYFPINGWTIDEEE